MYKANLFCCWESEVEEVLTKQFYTKLFVYNTVVLGRIKICSFEKTGQGPNTHTRFYFDGTAGWGTFADMSRFKDMPVTELSGAELKMVRKEVRGFG